MKRTYQPKKRKRARTHGFRARMQTRALALLGRVLRARERVQHEVAIRLGTALAVDALELGTPRQAAPLGATLRAHDPQTVSRLRPLSRRRLSTRRPARVLMRARNPWVRARLRFLGW